jgi:hypothetical protein
MRKKSAIRVLAVDPFSRGVGFAVLEGPECLVDWGLRTTAKADNAKSASVIQQLIERFRPDVLALEDWNAVGARRCARVETLLDGIAAEEGKRVLVRLIARREIRALGPLSETSTKYGRACLLADRFPELQAFLPPLRKLWMPEDDRMAIFDAVSFAAACLQIIEEE